MAERQISQHGQTGEDLREWEEEENVENDNVHQEFSQWSMPGGSNTPTARRADSSENIGLEVKDLLQVMVRQQAVQTKKLDLLESRLECTSSKVDQVALRIKSDDKKHFKKKGIEYQYKHNSAVIENYDEIELAVANTNYAALPALVNRGKSFVYKHQRIYRFADDKSWTFVKVYEADDIAIDSDDDKKIKKAEKRTKEIVDQRYKNKKSRFNNYSANKNNSFNDNYNSSRDSNSGFRQFRGNRSGNSWNQGSFVPYRIGVELAEMSAITAAVLGTLSTSVQTGVSGIPVTGRQNVS